MSTDTTAVIHGGKLHLPQSRIDEICNAAEAIDTLIATWQDLQADGEQVSGILSELLTLQPRLTTWRDKYCGTSLETLRGQINGGAQS